MVGVIRNHRYGLIRRSKHSHSRVIRNHRYGLIRRSTHSHSRVICNHRYGLIRRSTHSHSRWGSNSAWFKQNRTSHLLSVMRLVSKASSPSGEKNHKAPSSCYTTGGRASSLPLPLPLPPSLRPPCPCIFRSHAPVEHSAGMLEIGGVHWSPKPQSPRLIKAV